ncbi:MAG: TRAP transporter small permease [Azospirillaceae bacterium]
MTTRVLAAASRTLVRTERAADFLAAAGMFVVMTVVFADVGMRYLFNAPFSWSYDLISLYLVTAVFYASLSGTAGADGHVAVDILSRRFPLRLSKIVSVVSWTLTLGVFLLIAGAALVRAYAAWEAGDVIAGRIPWPTWIPPAIVFAGSGLFAFRLALMIVLTGLRAFTGTNGGYPTLISPSDRNKRL